MLDAEARSPHRGAPGRRPAKILHNVVLSMPAGTPAEKLLAASRAFAREQFALKHRYAPWCCTRTRITRTSTW